jgi:Na+-translocating ferredoxin:NAD+ oxidoreductase RnfD subunit
MAVLKEAASSQVTVLSALALGKVMELGLGEVNMFSPSVVAPIVALAAAGVKETKFLDPSNPAILGPTADVRLKA